MVPLFTGCGESLMFWKKKKKEVELVNKKLPPFQKLFNRTIELYNSQQYKDAIQAFLFLRENYPQKAEYQSRITLYIADSHYKLEEYPSAIANYEEFIKLYPTSPDLPYAYFQIGMCNYKQRRSYDRDASFVRKAIKNFEKVLQISPPGVLVNESIRMIALCQRELAMHEFYIADFYMRTHHYQSALLRYEDILNKFFSLKIYDRAHLGIAKAYLKLKDKNAAFRHLSYVAKNYPATPYGKEAWKILQKEFQVASVKELPDVTFPRKMPVEIAKTEKPAEPPVKEKKEETPKEVKPAPKKEAAPEPPAKKAEEKELAQKPQVYLPTISKVEKKPPAQPKPVKKAVEPPQTEAKTAKVTPAPEKAAPAPEKLPEKKVKEKPAPETPKTPAAKPPVKTAKVETEKAPPKPPVVEKPAPPMKAASPKPEKKKEATPEKIVEKKPAKEAPPAKTAEKKEVKPAPKQPAKPEAVKKAEAPKKPVPVVKKEAPASPKEPVKTSTKAEAKPAPKPEKMPENVKKMVKTDRLPPKKEKKGVGSSLGPVGAIDTRLPIHISSDHVEAQQGKNSVRFYGNVVVKQRDVTLKCDDLTAFYAAGGKAIDRIIAHGNVSIKQQNKKVTCGKAIFYNAARKIVLENSPTAWDGENKLSGSKMVLLLEKNEIQILGSKKKPTELVIYPGK